MLLQSIFHTKVRNALQVKRNAPTVVLVHRRFRDRFSDTFDWFLAWDTAILELFLAVALIVFAVTFMGAEWQSSVPNPIKAKMTQYLTINGWVTAMITIAGIRIAIVLLDASRLGTPATTKIRKAVAVLSAFWWVWMYTIFRVAPVALPGIYQPVLYAAASLWAFVHLWYYGGGVATKGGNKGDTE